MEELPEKYNHYSVFSKRKSQANQKLQNIIRPFKTSVFCKTRRTVLLVLSVEQTTS